MNLKVTFILLSIVAILMSGCSLKLKTKEIVEAEYHSAGNELELFGFGIGETMNNVADFVGEPYKKTKNYYSFPEENLKVYYQYNRSEYLATSNPEYRVLDKIYPGMYKEKLIQEMYNLDLFEYYDEELNKTFIFFSSGAQKVVLGMKDNSVEEIVLSGSNVNFERLIFKKDPLEEMEYSDEDLFEKAKFLNFNLDMEKNNRKAFSPALLPNAKIGLVEKVPLPIGTSKYELTRRFGTPNYVFGGNKEIEDFYYYKRFNLYLGFDKNEKLAVLRMPVRIPIEDFTKRQGLDELKDLDYGDYTLRFVTKDNEVTQILIMAKGAM